MSVSARDTGRSVRSRSRSHLNERHHHLAAAEHRGVDGQGADLAGLVEERSTNLMMGAEWKPMLGPGQALVEINAFSTRLTDLFHVRQADDPATDPLLDGIAFSRGRFAAVAFSFEA